MSEHELIGKRVDVLDQGWIELQDIMGSDLAIVNAQKLQRYPGIEGIRRFCLEKGIGSIHELIGSLRIDY